MENEDSIKGILVKGKNDSTVLKSKSIGEIAIVASNIKSMVIIHKKEEKKSTSIAQARYGQEKEDEPPLNFLTGSTVMMAPGSFEIEIGLNYKQNRQSYDLRQAGSFERSSYSARQVTMPLSVRAGLWPTAEGWLTVPFTYGKVREVSTNEYERYKEKFDIGDISFGLQQLVHAESENLPAISVSLGVSTPTGDKNYREPEATWKDVLDNGSGHWSVTPGVSFVRTVDPAILFGGVSYQYSFKKEIDGFSIKPGWALAGYMGVGFALNGKLSVGSQMSHAYYSEMKVDSVIIKGSDYEPTDLSFFASYRMWDNWVFNPELTFGLNDNSNATNFGFSISRKF